MTTWMCRAGRGEAEIGERGTMISPELMEWEEICVTRLVYETLHKLFTKATKKRNDKVASRGREAIDIK